MFQQVCGARVIGRANNLGNLRMCLEEKGQRLANTTCTSKSDWGYVGGRGVLTSSSKNDSLYHCDLKREEDKREIKRRMAGFYRKTDEMGRPTSPLSDYPLIT